MFRAIKIGAFLLAAWLVAEPAFAQYNRPNLKLRPNIIIRKNLPPMVKPPLRLLEMAITPSEAAAIAQGQYPGSKVVKVKLRGDIYAVTLVTDSSVVRIMVSGQDGSIM